MTICGVLVWYDESASWLGTAVSGMARVCDHVVAVDGAYALYPGGRPRSHPDQAEAILGACEAAGVGCIVHRPKTVWWGNEVEKRNFSLQLARPLLTPGEDWVLIFDGDYQVMQLDDPVFTRSLIENTDANVMTYTILDGMDVQADETIAAYARDHELATDWTFKDRGLFRWTDDLEYVDSHYFIRGTYGRKSQWVRGPEVDGAADISAPADDLGSNLVVVHRRNRRPKVRRDAADVYAKMRDQHGVEMARVCV